MKSVACPFLTRFSMSNIRQFAPLFLNYVDRCPVMMQTSRHQSSGGGDLASQYPFADTEAEVGKCPFLNETDVTLKKTSTAVEEDAIGHEQLISLQPRPGQQVDRG
ncbi:unnamed protein product, partial [Candidula unifasciata]